MPIYVFTCKSGHITEVFRHKPKPPLVARCNTCRKPATRSLSLERAGKTDCVVRVRYSDAMGINPDMIPEAMKKFPDSNYLPDGRLIVRSRADKKKKMKERGLVELG